MSTRPETVEVLNPTDRLFHGMSLAGLLGALVTGPFLRSPALTHSMGISANAVSVLHGLAALLVLAAGLMHLARVSLHWVRGGNPWSLVPTLQDWHDLVRGLGWGQIPLRLGRFSYRERISYAGFALSVPVLLLTGWAVAHPGRGGAILGIQGLLTSASLHAALGFCQAVFVLWHVYFAHLQPDVLFWNGSWITGRMSFERAQRLWPAWAESFLQAEPSSPAQEEAQPPSVEELLTAGNRAAQNGEYEDAERYYLEALEFYPGYSQALFNLGVVRLRRNDREGARDALTRFLNQDPFNTQAAKARQLLQETEEGGADG